MTRLKEWMRISIMVVVVVQSFCLVAPGEALPAEEESSHVWSWTLTGPYGGDAKKIAFDPSNSQRVYVGTNDGQIFESLDGGRSWRVLLSFNQPGFCIGELLVDPDDPKVIYVAGWVLFAQTGGGIFRSRDRGQTWETLHGMFQRSVRALVQAPGNRNVLVAGTLDGVFMSRDRGENWTRISPIGHPEIRNVESMAIDPRSDQVIYVGTWHLPWKTTDGGRTWFRTGSRESGMIDDSDVFSIVVDQNNPDTVFLSACTGIYKSSNGGKNWSRMNAVPSRSRRTLVLWKEPVGLRVVYAGTTEGLWKTSDGGVTWRLITPVRLIVQDIEGAPGNKDHVIVATENSGILVSSNGGQTFEMGNHGFSNRAVSVVVSDRTMKGRIYCGVLRGGNGGSFFVSVDGGMTWRDSSQNLSAEDVRAIHQSKANPNLIYSLTNRGIFQSPDRGMTWKRMPSIDNAVREPHPDQSIIQIGLLDLEEGGIVALKRDGIFLLREGETGWHRVLRPGGDTRGVSLYINEKNTIFVGTNKNVLVSRDRGKSWGEMPVPVSAGTAQTIIQHPSDDNLLFVGTPIGLLRSRNGGRTWERCNRGLPMADFVSITIRSESPDEMTVCDYKRGAVYFSHDRGESWERIDHVTAKSRAWMATFDPFDGNRLLLASSGAGVYVGVRQARSTSGSLK
jgi:photosystem II stability/assembly factor-like uncharacterized protein